MDDESGNTDEPSVCGRVDGVEYHHELKPGIGYIQNNEQAK
jgi:hypothetical protein